MTGEAKELKTLALPRSGGVFLVEASAGAGKTYCLVDIALRMMLEEWVEDVTRLLIVTFTNAATDELVTRLRRRLRDAAAAYDSAETTDDALRALCEQAGEKGRARARHALAHFDEAAVCTIHGFCQRMLQQAAFETGAAFDAELMEDDAELVQQAVLDFWRCRIYANETLAGVAAARGWRPLDGPLNIPGLFDAYRRHPNAALLPQTPSLDAAVERLDAARAALADAWSRQEAEKLAEETKWRRGALLKEDRRKAAWDRVEALINGDYAKGLKTVEALAPEAVVAAANKVGKHNKARADALAEHPIFQACGDVAEAASVLELALKCAALQETKEAFEWDKRRRRVLTFDDLLHQLRDALRSHSAGRRVAQAIRAQFQAALIDEFQDTDPVQFEIFARAFEGRPLYLIGDPKQSIYKFRGADVFAYKAVRDGQARRFTLGFNWRSDPGLVEAVNALFRRAASPFLFDWISFAPAKPADPSAAPRLVGDGRAPLQIWFFESDGEKPLTKDAARRRCVAAAAAGIAQLLQSDVRLDGRPVRPSDVAVLVRTNNEAERMQEGLAAQKVRSVISRAGDIFQSREMRELARVLTAVAAPRDAGAVRAALATEMWGTSVDQIQKITDDDDAWETLIETLEAYRSLWLSRGFMAMLEVLLDEQEVCARLLRFPDAERRLTNLRHAAELLHHASVEGGRSPDALLAWLQAERRRGHTEADRAELRLESDEEAVQIVTVHKSKGLEYGVVFCPFLWDSRPCQPEDIPLSAHTENGLVLHIGEKGAERKQEILESAEAERMAEDLRLAYVAVTRARHRCYLFWGDFKGAEDAALGYLLHPPPETTPNDSAERAKAIKAHLRQSRRRWREEAAEFARAHPKLVEATVLEADSPLFDAPEPVAAASAERMPPQLKPRRFSRGRMEGRGLASYSTLARRLESAAETPDYEDPPAAPADADAEATGIFAFARGARAGVCLHHLLERCDFQNVEDAECAARIRDVLAQHQLLDPAAHAGALDPVQTALDMLRRVAAAPLPESPGPFRLADIEPRRRLSEWRFFLPLADLASPDLIDLLRRRAVGPVRDEYAPLLARLSPARQQGFLTGFIDLVFERGGRWYLIDWKSNHLGDRPEAYDRAAMWRAMCEHHYVLQYHLYVVALTRFLQTRLPDYSYERCFGGVWYVFLRGVDGRTKRGWFFDRPPEALIHALDRRLAGRRGA